MNRDKRAAYDTHNLSCSDIRHERREADHAVQHAHHYRLVKKLFVSLSFHVVIDVRCDGYGCKNREVKKQDLECQVIFE